MNTPVSEAAAEREAAALKQTIAEGLARVERLIPSIMEAVRQDERERAARLAEAHCGQGGDDEVLKQIAGAIRAGAYDI